MEQVQQQHQDRSIKEPLTPAFGEIWLIPRLPLFWADPLTVDIDLSPSIKPVNLAVGRHDQAFRCRRGGWGQGEVHKIVSAEYTVVAPPKMMGSSGVQGLEALKKAVCLFVGSRVEHKDWATGHGLGFHAARTRL